jgi:hypothetical protein
MQLDERRVVAFSLPLEVAGRCLRKLGQGFFPTGSKVFILWTAKLGLVVRDLVEPFSVSSFSIRFRVLG